MDISVLQIFVEVMRQGNFAAVARDRNVDPSSISRAIASLEQELGIRLFQRTTRKLSPTEAGIIYFERIESLVEEIEQAFDVVNDVSSQPKGKLRITASVSFGLKCIIPLLPKFESLYPDLRVDLLLTDAVVDLLTDRIDVAVRLGMLADSTLIAQRLIPTHYLVCASQDYLKRSKQLEKPTDIENHNCLLFPLPGFRSRWIFKDQKGEISEVSVSGRTIISSAIALQECAIAGMGLALLPNWLVKEDLRVGNLVHIFPDYAVTATDFNTAAWLVYPSRTYIPLKVKVFIDFMKNFM
ncbi:MAG: LysR family transcriptional regulator [Sphaerospermopsis sp. SIO1G1]|nr:LysR family transcriptional regulator [Sphaerospermopsis sp. SIO1G1]